MVYIVFTTIPYSLSLFFFSLLGLFAFPDKVLDRFSIWFQFLCQGIRAHLWYNFLMTLNIDIDLDLDKVYRTRLGSYLKNCSADHHQICTQGSQYSGLSVQAIKTGAVWIRYVRDTFYVCDYYRKKFFVNNFATACWNVAKIDLVIVFGHVNNILKFR